MALFAEYLVEFALYVVDLIVVDFQRFALSDNNKSVYIGLNLHDLSGVFLCIGQGAHSYKDFDC